MTSTPLQRGFTGRIAAARLMRLMRLMRRIVLAGLALGCTVASAADDAVLTPFSSAPVGDAPAAWKFLSLPNKTPTRYAVVDLAGQRVLKVAADDSYGNLVHAVHLPVSEKTAVSWRWRVDQLVDGADLKTR